MELVKKVINAKDRYALLSLGSAEPIREGNDGYLNVDDEDVRRAYVKIAARIHPDKLPGVADATKAFQALVRAYEKCCKPDARADESDDSRDENDDDEEEDGDDDDDEDSKDEAALQEEAVDKKHPKNGAKRVTSAPRPTVQSAPALAKEARAKGAAGKARGAAQKAKSAADKAKKKRTSAQSDLGRVRTRVKCPRCFSEWGNHLKAEGNEATFTDLMWGLRQVHCVTCLFEFGCLTASHHCPQCDRQFEYRPSLFHRQHACTNKAGALLWATIR